MVRYFFHVCDGTLVLDDVGVELPDLRANNSDPIDCRNPQDWDDRTIVERASLAGRSHRQSPSWRAKVLCRQFFDHTVSAAQSRPRQGRGR